MLNWIRSAYTNILYCWNDIKKQMQILEFAVSFLLNYSKFTVYLTQQKTKLFDNFPIIKTVANCIYCVYLNTKSIIFCHKIEPFANTWISISVLLKKKPLGPKFVQVETYEYADSHIITVYNEYAKILTNISGTDENVIECMIIVKMENAYLFQTFDSNKLSTDLIELPTKLHKCKFLFVEYVHPIMDYFISIELNSMNIFEGSEILSSSFVRRYLLHQSKPYVFDEEYVLDIMDDKLNLFQINSTQSIYLTDDGYEIRNKNETEIK